MNIKPKTISYIQDRNDKDPMSRAHVSISNLSPFNYNQYEERPLKTNSQNLSFKGLSSFTESELETALSKIAKEFGKSAEENFKNKLNAAILVKESGLTKEGSNYIFKEKGLGRRAWDTLILPITQLPLDLANSTLGLLKKIPGSKNSKLLNQALNVNILKNRRQLQESISNVHSITSYLELSKTDQDGFKIGHKRLDPLISNYSTTAEKTITRLVTGAIPAFFLANDAYNLSIYMNNNKDVAKKEKQRRFYQEIARISLTAGATFAMLNIFSKSSNKSQAVSAALINLVTFGSEFLGRMIVGNPVLPLNEKDAKAYAQKRGKTKEVKEEKASLNTINKQDLTAKTETTKKTKKKGDLTIQNILKVLGGLVVFGFLAKKAQEIKSLKTKIKSIGNTYKEFMRKDFIISRETFNKLTDKLKENGFENIAEKYKDFVKDQKGEMLHLGRVIDRPKEILVHQVLMFPIRYAWKLINMPYKAIIKTGDTINDLIAKLNKDPKKVKPIEPKKEQEANTSMIQNGIKYLQKLDKIDDKKVYKDKLNQAILGGFDDVTKSNYSNSNFSNLVKNTTSAVTSGFLIADNYNLVMIDTQGQDKDLAEQKAKERTIQRAVRLMYGAFIIKFYNGLFERLFNGSLLGAQAVNALYAITTETLERESVGLPLKESTKEEIINNDKENMNAQGLQGAYFRLMAQLTGKKPISEKTV